MKKAGALANALRDSGARLASPSPDPSSPITETAPTLPAAESRAVQPSRQGLKGITVFYPEAVRRQLKMLAAEEGRNIDDMVGEALNLLFAKYRKPELAPNKASK